MLSYDQYRVYRVWVDREIESARRFESAKSLTFFVRERDIQTWRMTSVMTEMPILSGILAPSTFKKT